MLSADEGRKGYRERLRDALERVETRWMQGTLEASERDPVDASPPGESLLTQIPADTKLDHPLRDPTRRLGFHRPLAEPRPLPLSSSSVLLATCVGAGYF